MNVSDHVFSALQAFATSVTEKMKALGSGEPEEQLRSPFEVLLGELQKPLGLKIVAKGEAQVEKLGKPDFAAHAKGLLCGYVELKAPGKGARPERYKGHDKRQWERFKDLPNILYTDGNEWAVYRDGALEGKLVRLAGDVSQDGKKGVAKEDAAALAHLLGIFLEWTPIIPKGSRQIAHLLAPLCRMLRDEVVEAVKAQGSPLKELAGDWRKLLFPEASDQEFADAYAQTVTFALLLARSEGADALNLEKAIKILAAGHALLSKALEVLTDPLAKEDLSASLELLKRVIAEIPTTRLDDPADYPWLYFYEDFLAAYDPRLRKDAGAYYTPIEVVHAQVRLIDQLLSNNLGRPQGFADSGVVVLDPATGTGTYLLALIQHTLNRVKQDQGPGAVAGQAAGLAGRVYGFENMVGPYAVAQLRVSRSLMDEGARLPKGGVGIFLTDTLESPHAEPSWAGAYYGPMADQHKKALKVKKEVPVLVCLGNPPYKRHAAAKGEKNGPGGWVRWGDPKRPELGKRSILEDFLQPARLAGHGVHLKNLYNFYVYFWRWALWKVFEHPQDAPPGPGIVSFITASSYLEGDAFVGMREHMRRLCDEIWIIDLGGEGRGSRQEENVFSIQTPVAIAVAVRHGEAKPDQPAKVHYSRISGTRDVKLTRLEHVKNFASLKWKTCPEGWQAPFSPAGKGDFFSWPLLTDILPWHHSGLQFKRNWPIAPDRATLERRWQGLLTAKDRVKAFKETRDRKINGHYPSLLEFDGTLKAIDELDKASIPPNPLRYAFRTLDRHWALLDNRLGDYLRPSLMSANGHKQLYLASLLYDVLGEGPVLTCSAVVPDLHYFSGRGAKDILPLFRDRDATSPNITPGLLETLSKALGLALSAEDLTAYMYGVLAQPAFTNRFAKELEKRKLRVPLTKDNKLFTKVRNVGARLLWLHTYGERFIPEGQKPGQLPPGSAKCHVAISDTPEDYPDGYSYNEPTRTLHVGKGEFRPVALEVFEFEVSGLKVVQSWLKYRMKKGGGKKSSPLDDIRPERWTAEYTTDLLNLLWVLEATVAEYPSMAELLEAVVEGETFTADELPAVPEEAREAPKVPRGGSQGEQGRLGLRRRDPGHGDNVGG